MNKETREQEYDDELGYTPNFPVTNVSEDFKIGLKQGHTQAIKEEIEFLEKVIKRNRVNIPITKEQFERIISERKICEICHRKEQIHNLDLHHIIPRRNGGKSNDENLLLICGDCHKIIESMLYSGDIMAKRIVKERLEELKAKLSEGAKHG